MMDFRLCWNDGRGEEPHSLHKKSIADEFVEAAGFYGPAAVKEQERALGLAQRFADDPARFAQFCLGFGDRMRVDLSRQHWSAEVRAQLCRLASDMNLRQGIDALFGDNAFNHTEGRAALHTALRMPPEAKPCTG
ncbi:hypothetical protein MBH78_15470 [Oceanimonas sp. NS1]|nr:hypothetical protein [Oceanimonas sp. NS1]